MDIIQLDMIGIGVFAGITLYGIPYMVNYVINFVMKLA